eukprot:787453-Alexandrium_andersonii.AAC.1
MPEQTVEVRGPTAADQHRHYHTHVEQIVDAEERVVQQMVVHTAEAHEPTINAKAIQFVYWCLPGFKC